MPTVSSPARTVLRGGLVVDGTGSPARHAEVLIEGGLVAEVADRIDTTGAEVVDLAGLVLSPGFIDSHTHYDAQVLWDPDLTPTSDYGVTTVVMGNCGYSMAPAGPRDRELIVLTLEAVEGMSRDALQAGIDWSFETFAEYLGALRSSGTRLNVAAMVGHTTLRSYVMGRDATERPATEDEVARMAVVLRESLEAGAIGFSSSRSEVDNGAYGKPVGSRVADYSELLALAGVVGEHGKGVLQLIPCSLRDGPDAMAGVVADLDEASRHRPILFSSILTGAWGPPGTAVASVDTFGAIGSNVFPGVACMPLVQQVNLKDPFILTLFSTGFNEVLALDYPEREKLYRDEAWRERVHEGITAMGRWLDQVVVAESADTSRQGLTLGALAAHDGSTPVDAMVDLALAEHLETRFTVPLHNSDEQELKSLLLDSRCLLSLSDAGAHQSQICDAVFALHLLQRWVRELEALPLEFAVWRLTGHQAGALGLRDRGVIAAGLAADLVAFDPATVGYGPLRRVHDLPAGADRLVAPSTGIEHVWVNGHAIRRDSADTAERPLAGTVVS